jgi:type 1 glutamine amidotransferase
MIRFASIVALLLAWSSSAIADEKAKILFIGANPDHPHGSHMYMHTSNLLAKCAERTAGVQTVVSNGWPKDEKLVEGITGIVLYTSPGAELLLESPHRDAIDQLIKKGCGLTTNHWATAVREKNLDRLGATWFRYLGGTWVSNVGGLHFGDGKLISMMPDHPISRGWNERTINDEYYLGPTIKQAKPLLKVKYAKKKKDAETEHEVVVGWVYERPDGGRSFATTLGHPYRNFQDEAFRRMIVNGILWSSKIDIPQAGAPVDVDEAVLALPPAQK